MNVGIVQVWILKYCLTLTQSLLKPHRLVSPSVTGELNIQIQQELNLMQAIYTGTPQAVMRRPIPT